MQFNMLIITTNKAFLKDVLNAFKDQFEIKSTPSGKEALEFACHYQPTITLLDLNTRDLHGLDVLKELQKSKIEKKTIMFASYQHMESMVQAMKLGAYDYVLTNISMMELEKKIQKAIQILQLSKKLSPGRNLKLALRDSNIEKNTNTLIGQSKSMMEVYKQVGLVSKTNICVGIRGETGTGKELVAKAIHEHSDNRDEPFIPVESSTIVESLAESSFFGHEKGAFTGASESHKGLFEIAQNGTIFIDEVESLPISLQGKLLRFIQQKEFLPVGGNNFRHSNARIIAATNEDLSQLVKKEKFRKDLYYRLKVLTIYLPPLRERKEDIPLLIQYFLCKMEKEFKLPPIKIENQAIKRLVDYPWPGNIRELENLLLQVCIFSGQEVITEDQVTEALHKNARTTTGQNSNVSTLKEAEKKAILNAIMLTNGNISRAANILEVSRPTLRSKIRKFNIYL